MPMRKFYLADNAEDEGDEMSIATARFSLRFTDCDVILPQLSKVVHVTPCGFFWDHNQAALNSWLHEYSPLLRFLTQKVTENVGVSVLDY